MAIHDLLAQADLTREPCFRQRAERNLRAFSPELERFPGAVAMLAAAVLRAGGPTAAPGRPWSLTATFAERIEDVLTILPSL